MPAVQKPHCSAWCSWKASCRRPGARPSIVVISQPVDLDRERQAGADGSPSSWTVHDAADAVLAADLGAGQAELVADEVGEQRARLDLGGAELAVDAGGDARAASVGPGAACRSPGGRGRAADRRSRSCAARFDERAAGELGDEGARVVASTRLAASAAASAALAPSRSACSAAGARRAPVRRGRRRGPRSRRGRGRARRPTAASAKSPWVRAYSLNAVLAPGGSGGTTIAMRNSAGARSQRARSAR